MSGKRQDGIRTLPDLLGRCRIDGETGCAVWHQPDDTRTWIPAGVLSERRVIMRAPRAAWLLAGKRLPPGWQVHRLRPTCPEGCVSPEHGIALTKQAAGEMVARDRRQAATPDRRAINLANGMRRSTPLEVVRRVEEMLSKGHKLAEICEACDITHTVVRRIRKGAHPYCAGRQTLVRGASVFTLGVAA